jgi:dipeptidyl aminopeptidase/acylaminoacyl peptidase
MSMLRTILAASWLSALAAAPALAQAPANGDVKKPLDHDAYDIWNRISTQAISDDGRYVLYVQASEANDPRLFVKDAASGATLHEFERGDDGQFTDDSRFVVFRLKPAKTAVEAARAAKKRPDQMPRDSIAILDLMNGGIVRAPNVATFEVPAEAGGWVAYHLGRAPAERDSAQADTTRAPGAMPEPNPAPAGERPSRERRQEERREDGTTLVVRNLGTGEERRIEFVSDYQFTDDGTRLVYVATSRDGTADGIFLQQLVSGQTTPLLTGKGDYEQLAIDESGSRIAFLSNRDDFEAKQPAFALYVSVDGEAASELADTASDALPDGWWISDNGDLSFSDGGGRLFFGTAPRPEPPPDSTDAPADDEKVVVDIWAWTDPYLQPMQLRQLEEERNRTYRAMANVRDGKVVQLATEEMPDILLVNGGDASYFVGRSNLPYRQEVSWGESGSDYFLVDPATGSAERILEYRRGNASLSDAGRYLSWFDGEQRHWFVMDLRDRSVRNVSESIPHPVQNELHDSPSLPGSYGSAGWTLDDGAFLLYDSHDIWAVDPTGRTAPRNITEGVGRRENVRFRYVDLSSGGGGRGGFGGGGGGGGGGGPDEAIDPEQPILLSAFHLWNKTDGFYSDRVDGTSEPVRLIMAEKSLGSPRKAEDADVLLLTRASFQEFPDLYITGLDFREFRRISDANPQQSEYRWGTSELVQWNSATGEVLQGVLYKPDGFDPARKYPMMVYFYERLSDRLNSYVVPAAGSSSINISFYVSRGYLVFTPDIPYRVGYPGESAMNAVVPGVLSLVERGFIDRDNIGVQGHSWGGYQIAYMVTETGLFAAAEAGAPVANMISAYGGIRWSSGMSRMFQYEKTQSRIGGTLWEQPLRFIENSPIFYADKVDTPLLMLHNDQDGAVPWEQGIEYFVALRRLQKPVWMLNYNGEDHGLRKEQNQKDWAVRMQQFFDHYLMDASMPVWMSEGVSAINKGKTLGLELITELPKKPITEQPPGSGHN